MNVQAQEQAQVLQLTRQIKASRQAVFAALTDAEALAAWFGPEGITAKEVKVDLKPGGSYSMEMHNAEGLLTTLSGVYQEITRPERLVFTWVWGMGDLAGLETLVTIELDETPDGCQLSLTHERLPSATAVEKHAYGWTGGFNGLDAFLAS